MLDFDKNIHLVKPENCIFFSDAGFVNNLFANCYYRNLFFRALRDGTIERWVVNIDNIVNIIVDRLSPPVINYPPAVELKSVRLDTNIICQILEAKSTSQQGRSYF